MKISFSILNILGSILIISTFILLLISYYDPTLLFSEESKHYKGNVKNLRFGLTILGLGILVVYLGPLEGYKHLTKKRTINLTPWKNGN